MSFCIIGSDKRYDRLKLMLSPNAVSVSLADCSSDAVLQVAGCMAKQHRSIILPIPLSRDNLTLNLQKIKQPILLCDILPLFSDNEVFAGAVSSEICGKYPFIKDFAAGERFSYKNAVLTAEGLIAEIISKTDIGIFNSNILIIGFGRIAKLTAVYLDKMGGRITVSARSEKARAEALCCEYSAIDCDNISLSDFDIVINTVPSVLINESVLKTAENAVIFDVASTPFGVDFEAAKKLDIPAYLLPSLPSIYSPGAAAKVIFEEIISLQNE